MGDVTSEVGRSSSVDAPPTPPRGAADPALFGSVFPPKETWAAWRWHAVSVSPLRCVTTRWFWSAWPRPARSAEYGGFKQRLSAGFLAHPRRASQRAGAGFALLVGPEGRQSLQRGILRLRCHASAAAKAVSGR